ncbi:MAG: hypothetical protein HGA23_10430, partial [Bacteroidales bacterium]|nr:hypothetical protein [Bacteroidales bacterium]
VSPGPCTPTEAGISLEAISALAGECPVLGVCLGHQAMLEGLERSLGKYQIWSWLFSFYSAQAAVPGGEDAAGSKKQNNIFSKKKRVFLFEAPSF